jgi:hypothetical protein
MTGIPQKTLPGRVQTAYTEQDVSAIVHAQKDAGKSLRSIAAEYGAPVNHADIERILQGKFPHNAAKRHALGLPPVCASCGQKVHRVRIVPEWVKQGADFLAEREKANHKDTKNTKEIRTYSRSGKRVPA